MAYTATPPIYVPPPRSRRKKRPRQADRVSHERWLVSYADFITLLFAFFTTLYAISTVDGRKLTSMVDSMQAAFEPGAAADQPRQGLLAGNRPPPQLSKGAGPGGEVGLADIEKRVTTALATAIAEKRVDIEIDQRGLVISVREAGSFTVGSADLSGDAQALLVELGTVLATIDNLVQIEGHTDDVPIHTTRFASNWELSTARATNVIAYLLEHAPLRPKQFSAAGYAEFHPRVPNASAADRARNRRVDIVILKPSAADSPGPTG